MIMFAYRNQQEPERGNTFEEVLRERTDVQLLHLTGQSAERSRVAGHASCRGPKGTRRPTSADLATVTMLQI